MTESESSPRVRITRSMLGRLAAVGLFLCLGTLAVMHTVTNRKAATAESTSEVAKEGEAAKDANATDLSATPTSNIANNPAANAPQIGNKPLPNLTTQSVNPSTQSSTAPPTRSFGNANSSTMSGGYPIGKSESKPPIAPPALTAREAQESNGGVPALNTSSQIKPPPAMSFGNSPAKMSLSDEQPSTDTSPAIRAQIQVESDDDSTGVSTQPYNKLPAANNSPLLNNASKPAATNESSPGGLPAGIANRGTPSTENPNPLAAPSLAGGGTTQLSSTSTPYDAPTNSAGGRPFTLPSTTASSNETQGPAANQQNANQQSEFSSSSVLRNNGGGNLLDSATKPNPLAPAKTAVENNLIRPSVPNAGSNTTFGSNSTAPRDSFASAQRTVNSIPNVSGESVRVQSTPGAANLEGPQVPSLKLQKLAPREVQINKPAELQLVVQNAGQVPAEQVVVHDRIPDGTELIDATPKANQSSDGTLSWNLGTIAPGETSKITLNLMPRQPGEFGSVAQVTFAAQASARTLCTQPILGIEMSSKPKVLIGDDVFLDIVVENKGDGPATNVLLQEDVPDLLTFEDGSRELEFEIGTLAPGQKRSVQLRLKAAKVGLTQNRIVAQGDAGIEVSDVVEMEVISPDLQATGDGPARKYLNRQATHEFAVNNAGTAPANNVDFVAKLPRGLKFVSANNHGQYDANTNSVYWSLQQLAAGQIGRVELVTLPIEPGDQKIDFEATADLNQKASLSKSLFVEYLVELFCEIDDLTDPIEIGNDTAYRVKVVNQGLQAATNIRLNVDFPAGIEPMSVSGSVPHQIQGQRVVFSPIDRLDAQQETVVTITAKGTVEGDHRVVVSMSSDARETQIAKEESTQVYSDQR